MNLDYKIMDNDYCVKLAEKHGDGSKINLVTKLDNTLFLGYDVYLEKNRIGVVFVMKIGDYYTLDGYSELTGMKGMIAFLTAGKKVMKELFDNHTSIIVTEHKESEENLTVLCERMGFVEQNRYNGRIIMAAGETVRPHYKNMLLLSGGKDSCALAYQANPKDTLAFTYDQGFLSDTARDNIAIVLEQTGLNHIYLRANHYTHRVFMGQFIRNKEQKMEDICTKCSSVLQDEAIRFAKQMGIKTIIAGFTAYTAEIYGGSKEAETMVGDIKIVNPHKKSYSIKKIAELMDKKGLEFDPLKTNCIFIEKIIETHKRRHGENPFKKEADLLLNDEQITQKQYNYYMN